MSRRTSEASKAIRAAWLKEQELVAEGKGTRNWTPEQQKEILELGKAYYHSENPDDINDGKAFEGHHMKSAEAYPEYQGAPENIQFLSRPEHKKAHGGDYRNPTNGYFDPVTKTTRNFGDNIFEPCEIIKLSDPIVSLNDVVEVSLETTEISLKNVERSFGEEQQKNTHISKKPSDSKIPAPKSSPKARKGIGEFIMKAVKVAKGFSKKHPVLTAVGVTFVAVGTEVIANRGKGSGGNSRSVSSDNYFSSSSDDHNIEVSKSDDYDDGVDDYDDVSLTDSDNLEVRTSPKEHTVSAHGQHYHTNDGLIWKEKQPYPRGGKHDEDLE